MFTTAPATPSLARAEPEPADAGTLLAERTQAAGRVLLRGSLALVLLWIGAMKFTGYEAEGIRVFVEHSPLFAWSYGVFGIQGMSNILGVTEIAVALLIAARPWSPTASAAGSLAAVGMFASTLSFLLTTPGAWVADLGGFPALGILGQFLIKDAALLAISVWSLGEALQARAKAARAA